MALPVSGNVTGSGAGVKRVTAGAGLDFSAIDFAGDFGVSVKTCCCGIYVVTAGSVSYVNPQDKVIVAVLPAGYHPIIATGINAASAVDVIAYF